MAKDETTDKPRTGVLGWILPMRQIRRARASVLEAHQAVKSTLEEATHKRSQELDPNDVRRIEDGSRRFEIMYEMHGWTESELREQMRAVRATKVTAMALTAMAFLGSMGAILMVPTWSLIFVLPIGGCITILCAAQAFRYALWEAQLQERSFIDAKTFIAMKDFWQRLLG